MHTTCAEPELQPAYGALDPLPQGGDGPSGASESSVANGSSQVHCKWVQWRKCVESGSSALRQVGQVGQVVANSFPSRHPSKRVKFASVLQSVTGPFVHAHCNMKAKGSPYQNQMQAIKPSKSMCQML